MDLNKLPSPGVGGLNKLNPSAPEKISKLGGLKKKIIFGNNQVSKETKLSGKNRIENGWSDFQEENLPIENDNFSANKNEIFSFKNHNHQNDSKI